MSRFWEIVFCLPFLFRRHVCLSKLKHSPSRELPLTARKTVFSHLKSGVQRSPRPVFWKLQFFPYIFCNFDTFELQKMYGNIMNIMEYRGIPFHRKEFQASDMSCLSVAQLVSRVSKAYIELHSVVFYTSFNLRCWYGGTFVRKLKSRN